MIALPIIQEQNQEDICDFCIKEIWPDKGCGHFGTSCEGSYCEQANEMFYWEYPERVDHLEFNYWPSKEIKEAEESLDKRIEFFTRKVNFKYSSMVLHHRINS